MAAGAARLREALALWAGEALADLDDMSFGSWRRPGLQDLRVSAVESLLWAELDLGRPAEVAEMARHTVSEYPYRERAWCALMPGAVSSGPTERAATVEGGLNRPESVHKKGIDDLTPGQRICP